MRKFTLLLLSIVVVVPVFAADQDLVNANWNSTPAIQSVVRQDGQKCGANSWNCVSAVESKNQQAKQTIDGNHTLEAAPKTGANSSYVNPNNNTYDQNAVANFNITDANQSTLQSYSPLLNNQSTKDMLIQNTTIPFKAGNSTSLNVGTNKVEFNISY